MTEGAEFQKERDLAPTTNRKRSDSGFSWGLALFLVTAVVFVVFVVQNPTDVPVQFFNAEYTVPLPILLVTTALIAVIADEIFGWARRRSRRQRLAEKEELGRFRGEAT
ncbi:MAG: LapA family protein [Acidimicrobiia bacterium]